MTTQEPRSYLEAQARAFEAGRKSGLLVTAGEFDPEPQGFFVEVPEGKLYVKHLAALARPLGEVLGYGINYKPLSNLVLTVREASGQIIHEVISDGGLGVWLAGLTVAGPGGSVEYRTLIEAMLDRHGSVDGIVEALYG